MKRIMVVVGGRPNYIKLAPIVRAIDGSADLECILVDAQQHYSANMRDIFFDVVGLRKPDFFLGCNGTTHATQTASAMEGMETLLDGVLPGVVDYVLVHGDMNYALGCALAAVKLHIPVIHNEAGLRSFDRRMPEEINRILIDHMASHHIVTEDSGLENLKDECIDTGVLTGSTLTDTMCHVFDCIPKWHSQHGGYAVLTMHRPESVDDPKEFARRIDIIANITNLVNVKWVTHPRLNMEMLPTVDGLEYIDPLGYDEMIELMIDSAMVITDSGGLQEETTVLGVPCLMWRDNTERPATIDQGSNHLATDDVYSDVKQMLTCAFVCSTPPYWDGKASERIVEWMETL